MDVRRFDADQLAMCARWFDLVETDETWTVIGPIGEGESQSELVECVARGRARGVAKPGPPMAADLMCRAAHEKLAFDLAHTLGLPVSPVILWRDGLGNPFVRGRSISAWCFGQSSKWDYAQSAGILTPELIASASDVSSAMRVFHSWISDTDRKSDHTHINADCPKGELQVAYIDHGHAMSQCWKSETHPDPSISNYMHSVENRAIMCEAADAIKAIPVELIEKLINRIPEEYLPAAERKIIRANLISRQGTLRGLLGL